MSITTTTIPNSKRILTGLSVALTGSLLAVAAAAGVGAFGPQGIDSIGPASQTLVPARVAIHASATPSLVTIYLVGTEEAAAYLRAQDEVASAAAAGNHFFLVGRTIAEANALGQETGGDWQVVDLRSR